MSRNLVAAGAAAVVLATAGTAHAQYWLGDRALNEGHGFRAGDFEFHPGIGVEFGYNSNVFLSPSNAVSTPTVPGVTPAAILRVTPSIAIGTLSARRLEGGGASGPPPTAIFRANLSATYYHFFPLTSTDNVSSLSNVGGQAGFFLGLFPQRTWQFILRDDAVRVVPGSQDIFSFGTAIPLYQGIRNSGAVDLVYAPNNGIIDFRLSYTNSLLYFDQAAISYYNSDSNNIALRAHWRFLPRTSLMWEGGIAPTFFFNTTNEPTGLFSSHPLYTRFGLNGLLTERIQVLALIGWESTYYSGGDNANTVIAQAEIKYIFGPRTSFQFGLQRDVQPSFIGNYYVRNRAYLQFTQIFAGRFSLSAQVSAGLNQYGFATTPAGVFDNTRIAGADAAGHWNAFRLDAVLFGEYRFTDWFGLNATLLANTNVPLGGVTLTSGGATASIDWVDFQAFVGVRVSY